MDTITFEAVTKVFRRSPSWLPYWFRRDIRKSRALDDVSLNAHSGEILVLLGPNGSGKTTLLKLVSTMLLPDAGRVAVCGAETRTRADEVRSHVGFVVASERSFFPRLTARENLDVFAALDDVPRKLRPPAIDTVLEQADLISEADNLVLTFSSGMYQRLGLARALIKHPSVLLLDEPTRSIDAAASMHIWGLLRRLATEGCTLILATHRFDEAVAMGDSIAFLRAGKLLAIQPLPRGTSPEDLRAMYFRQLDVFDKNAVVCGSRQ